MKKFKFLTLAFAALFLSAAFTSCNKDDDDDETSSFLVGGTWTSEVLECDYEPMGKIDGSNAYFTGEMFTVFAFGNNGEAAMANNFNGKIEYDEIYKFDQPFNQTLTYSGTYSFDGTNLHCTFDQGMTVNSVIVKVSEDEFYSLEEDVEDGKWHFYRTKK